MKLEVGMYVRTKDGYIAKIKEIEINERLHLYLKAIYTDNYHIDMILEDEISKASYNIIDLIEVGDYVNGEKVLLKNEGYIKVGTGRDYIVVNNEKFIKSIVTKEMYSSVEYRVETN